MPGACPSLPAQCREWNFHHPRLWCTVVCPLAERSARFTVRQLR